MYHRVEFKFFHKSFASHSVYKSTDNDNDIYTNCFFFHLYIVRYRIIYVSSKRKIPIQLQWFEYTCVFDVRCIVFSS